MVKQWKKDQVKKFKEMFEEPVVGIISLEGLPSAQFQEIKKELRGKAEIKVGRRTLIKRAINKVEKEGIKDLEEHLEGPCGIIASEKDPFRLYKTLQEKKSEAKAKPGKTVEKEVTVPEGPTNLQPGPILGNLQKASIPAQIKGDKIVVNQDKKLLEPGDEVTEDIAIALNTLDIKPLEVGIEIKAILEEGTIFTPEDLHVDEEETLKELQLASQKALNLSIESNYFNKESVEQLISKAGQEALNLSLDVGIINKDTIEKKLAEAYSQAKSLSHQVED